MSDFLTKATGTLVATARGHPNVSFLKILAYSCSTVVGHIIACSAQARPRQGRSKYPEESATGTLTGSEIGSTGDYQITSAAITVTGSAISGTGTLDTNVRDLAAYGADNEIYPSQNAVDRSGYDLYLDLGGLLFTTGSDVYNLWGVITTATPPITIVIP